MKFSIITPSFRNSEGLKLCIASVADQEGVQAEHIIQDACSDDGTQDWLPKDGRVRAFVEKDNGMYDAINRGYRRANGDLLAHLNSDEQYLPGALKAVHDFFEKNPSVEVLCGGVVVVGADGGYVCHRHALLPDTRTIYYRFNVLTASIFMRRRVIHERGFFLDSSWRAAADALWFLSLVKARVPMTTTDLFTSTFTDDGKNLSLSPVGRKETLQMQAMAPFWVRWLKPVWIAHHRLRRLSAGHFDMKSAHYEVYTPQSPAKRVRFDVPNPTGVWRNRL
ncbi:MAG TPA: glycosyltransferase [Verrucomicrobiota bacterium]|nr:glycosyltransferase [Verrucomicrobiota bacterium]